MANLGPELEAGTHLGAGGLMGNPGTHREGGAAVAMSHNYWETGLRSFQPCLVQLVWPPFQHGEPLCVFACRLVSFISKGTGTKVMPRIHNQLICGPPVHCISKRT